MHQLLAEQYVASIKRRASQGDCPTEAPLSVEALEDLALTLDALSSLPAQAVDVTEGNWLTTAEIDEYMAGLGPPKDTDGPHVKVMRRALAEIQQRRGAEAENIDRCLACAEPLKEGDLVYLDASGDIIHAKCCGPERESYTGKDGEPLKDGEPIPTPWEWTAALAPRPAEHPMMYRKVGLPFAIG